MPKRKAPAAPAAEEEYEVERVVDERKASGGRKEYRVRWKGYGEEDDTWEPMKNLGNVKGLVDKFVKSKAAPDPTTQQPAKRQKSAVPAKSAKASSASAAAAAPPTAAPAAASAPSANAPKLISIQRTVAVEAAADAVRVLEQNKAAAEREIVDAQKDRRAALKVVREAEAVVDRSRCGPKEVEAEARKEATKARKRAKDTLTRIDASKASLAAIEAEVVTRRRDLVPDEERILKRLSEEAAKSNDAHGKVGSPCLTRSARSRPVGSQSPCTVHRATGGQAWRCSTSRPKRAARGGQARRRVAAQGRRHAHGKRHARRAPLECHRRPDELGTRAHCSLARSAACALRARH